MADQGSTRLLRSADKIKVELFPWLVATLVSGAFMLVMQQNFTTKDTVERMIEARRSQDHEDVVEMRRQHEAFERKFEQMRSDIAVAQAQSREALEKLAERPIVTHYRYVEKKPGAR